MARFGAPFVLVALAVGLSWSHWAGPVTWTPDGLFYESQARELTGTPGTVARHEVFFVALGPSPVGPDPRFSDRRWISFSAPFYRRRWVVPALSDAIRPLFGTRSLLLVSLLGYVFSGLLAYALARRRFGVVASLAAGVFTLWFPPMRTWSAYPLTDSMGVATLLLALLAALWALDGRRARVGVWAASVLLLAFTRDVAVIAVGGALALALFIRTRRSLEIFAAGLVAALPSLLFFGAPLRKTLAFTFNYNSIPPSESWHFILSRYGMFVRQMLQFDFPFASSLQVVGVLVGIVALTAIRPADGTRLRRLWAVALVLATLFVVEVSLPSNPIQSALFKEALPDGVLLVCALLPLFLPQRERDPFSVLLRGGTVFAAAYLFLLPQWTALRLALVLLPFAAIGVARAVELTLPPSQPAENHEASVPTYIDTSSLNSSTP